MNKGLLLCILILCIVVLGGCSVEFADATPTPIATATPRATDTPLPPPASPTPVGGTVPITVQLIGKSFHQADFSVTGDESQNQFTLQYTNKTGKNIKAFTFTIHFQDLFGRDIKSATVTYEQGLAAGANVTWDGGLHFNQFIDADIRLRDIDLKDLQIQSTNFDVIFADGSRQKYP